MSQDGIPHKYEDTLASILPNASEGPSLRPTIVKHCCCWETVLQHLAEMLGTPDLVHWLVELRVLQTVRAPCQ